MKRLVSGVAAALAILPAAVAAQQMDSQANSTVNVMAITGPQTQVPQQQEVTYGGHTWTTPSAQGSYFGGANPCLVGTGGGAAGGPIAFNINVGRNDEGCQRRSDAAAWHAMGFDNVAIARMCQDVKSADAFSPRPARRAPVPWPIATSWRTALLPRSRPWCPTAVRSRATRMPGRSTWPTRRAGGHSHGGAKDRRRANPNLRRRHRRAHHRPENRADAMIPSGTPGWRPAGVARDCVSRADGGRWSERSEMAPFRTGARPERSRQGGRQVRAAGPRPPRSRSRRPAMDPDAQAGGERRQWLAVFGWRDVAFVQRHPSTMRGQIRDIIGQMLAIGRAGQ